MFSSIENALIYCDIPYQGTTEYKDSFNHNKFYRWVVEMSRKGNKVFISEYSMPPIFTEVWSLERTQAMQSEKDKKKVEKIFTFNV